MSFIFVAGLALAIAAVVFVAYKHLVAPKAPQAASNTTSVKEVVTALEDSFHDLTGHSEK